MEAAYPSETLMTGLYRALLEKTGLFTVIGMKLSCVRYNGASRMEGPGALEQALSSMHRAPLATYGPIVCFCEPAVEAAVGPSIGLPLLHYPCWLCKSSMPQAGLDIIGWPSTYRAMASSFRTHSGKYVCPGSFCLAVYRQRTCDWLIPRIGHPTRSL
jgi:hypothetical protein